MLVMERRSRLPAGQASQGPVFHKDDIQVWRQPTHKATCECKNEGVMQEGRSDKAVGSPGGHF